MVPEELSFHGLKGNAVPRSFYRNSATVPAAVIPMSFFFDVLFLTTNHCSTLKKDGKVLRIGKVRRPAIHCHNSDALSGQKRG